MTSWGAVAGTGGTASILLRTPGWDPLAPQFNPTGLTPLLPGSSCGTILCGVGDGRCPAPLHHSEPSRDAHEVPSLGGPAPCGRERMSSSSINTSTNTENADFPTLFGNQCLQTSGGLCTCPYTRLKLKSSQPPTPLLQFHKELINKGEALMALQGAFLKGSQPGFWAGFLGTQRAPQGVSVWVSWRSRARCGCSIPCHCQLRSGQPGALSSLTPQQER